MDRTDSRIGALSRGSGFRSKRSKSGLKFSAVPSGFGPFQAFLNLGRTLSQALASGNPFSARKTLSTRQALAADQLTELTCRKMERLRLELLNLIDYSEHLSIDERTNYRVRFESLSIEEMEMVIAMVQRREILAKQRVYRMH